jgi:hypothetical protein
MKNLSLVVVIAVVLALGGQASAKNVLKQITPQDLGKQRNAFAVKATDAGKFKQFEISARLTASTNFLTPGAPRGELAIVGKEGKTEAVTMSKVDTEGRVTFTIRVAKEDLDKAWFIFTENSDSDFPYPGEMFKFHLKDFVGK